MPQVPDAGVYHVYVGDRVLGVERFSFDASKDSVFINSRVAHSIQGPDGPDSLNKFVQVILSRFDLGLRWYQSDQDFLGRKLTRGLVLDDTLYTAYWETPDVGGVGERRVRPPGRLYVIDAQSFVMFDVLCRSFHGKTFDERPFQVLALGEPDTLVEAAIKDLGNETIRWGGRPIEARKLRIWDQNTEFLAWVSPRGYLLRLQQPVIGLRVERDPPPIKRRKP